jgi:2-amino-4-hydroxy-6-hydroxymethyldihydropteridine diphosphokinase
VTTVYLALGSNEGDFHQRLRLLRYGVELLEEFGELAVEATSKVYETQSVEGGGEGDFSNAVIRAKTSLSAVDLLHQIHIAEMQMGRDEPSKIGAHRSGPRPLDIDILLFGDEEIREPGLQVPHPRALRRNFVLRPLLDVLEGGWIRETRNQL